MFQYNDGVISKKWLFRVEDYADNGTSRPVRDIQVGHNINGGLM